MVMVSVVGLALKDHGRARTLKGLRAGDAGGLAAPRPAMLPLQGPCPAMVLSGQATSPNRGAHPTMPNP